MSNRLYPCSVNDPLGEGTHSGLLGHGTLPWPSVIAERQFPTDISISGFYATDELSAAHFMVATLSDPDNGLDAQEHEQMALHLSYLLSKVKVAGYVTVREVKELHQKAQSIPVIGPALFSLSSLPSTTAALSALAHASFKSAKMSELLDVPPGLKKQLLNWASSRGAAGTTSAKRAFKNRIKLIRLQGKLHFEIPANARAKMYKLGSRNAANIIHLPVYHAAQSLRKRIRVSNNNYSSRGVGRYLTGGPSAILTMAPQAMLDAAEAESLNEFLRKSSYSQPTIIGGIILGAAAGVLIGGSAIVVISLGIAATIIVSSLMSDGVTGWGTGLGDFITESYL